LNVFEQYYTVPEEMKGEFEIFKSDLLALAESSADSQAFEAAFMSSGLSDRYNGLLTRCTPKPYEMTEADKAASKEVRKQMFEENKEQIAKDILSDAADSVMMKAESDLITKRREAMIESGTLDEYTRATNAVEDIGWFAKSIGKFFGKNKK